MLVFAGLALAGFLAYHFTSGTRAFWPGGRNYQLGINVFTAALRPR